MIYEPVDDAAKKPLLPLNWKTMLKTYLRGENLGLPRSGNTPAFLNNKAKNWLDRYDLDTTGHRDCEVLRNLTDDIIVAVMHDVRTEWKMMESAGKMFDFLSDINAYLRQSRLTLPFLPWPITVMLLILFAVGGWWITGYRVDIFESAYNAGYCAMMPKYKIDDTWTLLGADFVEAFTFGVFPLGRWMRALLLNDKASLWRLFGENSWAIRSWFGVYEYLCVPFEFSANIRIWLELMGAWFGLIVGVTLLFSYRRKPVSLQTPNV